MKIRRSFARCACLGALTLAATRFTLSGAPQPVEGELLAIERTVEFSRPGTNWVPAKVGLELAVLDRLRTLALSRATVRLAELGRLRVNELTTLEILPAKTASSKATLDLKAGALYFFTREKPREFLLQTPYAIAASRGTEFLTVVEPDGRTVMTVFDGEVELANSLGTIVLTNGEQGAVQVGQAPLKTPAIRATNVVQWWLYYPGVLDTADLGLTPAQQSALAASIAAYNAGDLRQALQTYPAGRLPQTDSERIYYAGLLLSVGQVDKAEDSLGGSNSQSPLAYALQQVISTVTGKPGPSITPSNRATLSATELLAASYVQQPTNLAAALESARAATQASPEFGFAWERVAELEFSFGRIGPAKQALSKALELSPRNAQALALRGFIRSAENHIAAALEAFEQAIATDPALANGWLGRGLCRIRTGDAVGGRADLQTAATLESNRSLLRSYLGKAFNNLYDLRHAGKELALAQRLDHSDPTAWLYSALLEQQQNRLNEGVDDLERSLDLNDNRGVYRSRLLLDQDRAVRSASLATIYQKAGMEDVSYRQAAQAVNSDYANYSAHLFLANSLEALSDPTRFNLRYETAAINELLLANLLAPVGAGTLSQSISQQEYSKLFEANRLGLVTDTSWRSDRQFQEVASQFGTFGGTSYALDLNYQHNEGVRPNNELTINEWNLSVKQELTAQDSVYLSGGYQHTQAGDNNQYYDPQTSVRTNFNFEEHESPIVTVGYNRTWAPGVHTLFLGAYLSADQHFSDLDANRYELVPASPVFPVNVLGPFPFNVDYRNDFDIFSAELNQIIQTERQTLVIGARYQNGEFSARDAMFASMTNRQFLVGSDTNHSVQEDFERITGYGYYTVELPDQLFLTGGLAYDQITYPLNYRDVPVTPGEAYRDQFGPKAALVWNLLPEATIRAAYAKSLGGVSFDQSYRLEPTQLAGFNQAFRTIISEAEVGSVSAPTFETVGAALDLKFKTRTYLSIQGQILQSDVDRTIGIYVLTNGGGSLASSSTLQALDYKEQNVVATVNQLLGDEWSLGVRYQYTHSNLKTAFPQIPKPAINLFDNTDLSAELHQVTPYIVFNHPSGFFARAEAPWYSQHNSGFTPPQPGDEFFQVNLFAGYRLPRQYGEFTLGLLNLEGRDYHLNPLNLYAELPHERVWSLRLRLSF